MKPTSATLYAAVGCISSLLCLGPAGAQDKVSAQLEQLSAFIGDGTCTGNLLMKHAHPTTARYHSEKTLGDRWIMVQYDEEATPSNARPYHVAQYFSYDAKAGHFIDVILDNSGENYGAGTSSGWQGNVITFENTVLTSGGHFVFRDVFTLNGAKVASHTGYQRDKSGKWVKTDHETCKRT
jgi:hypothetical protein